MRRISKRKVGIAFLILIAAGMFMYQLGEIFTGNAVLEPMLVAEKIHPEVLHLAEESAGEKITVLVKQDDKEKVSEIIKEIGGEIKGSAFDYLAVEIPADKLEEVAEDKQVEGIYPDRVYYATLDGSAKLIKADAAWNENYLGAGIKIAILDTGIDESHPMLRGKIIAAKAFTGESSTQDVRGHGTHVAGIAAGKDDGGGLRGVAPDALLMNAKVLNDDGKGTTSQIIQGIAWAVDPDGNPETDDGADVISMSLGGSYATPDPAYVEVIREAISRGVVVIASSGNCGPGCPSASCGSYRGVTVPGNIKEVISVGAVGDSKQVACFSSGQEIPGVGIKPDVVAPGVDIASSWLGGSYSNGSGTSMAAPHVAGVAALLLEKNPGYTPQQVKRILEATAEDLGGVGKDVVYGSGFVNVERAFQFDAGSLLEFDVEHLPQIVQGGIQKIQVRIFDDVVVESVVATLVYPDEHRVNYSLSLLENNTYVLNFSDTAFEGGYKITIALRYGAGFTAARDASFNVVAPSLFAGKIVETGYAKEIFSGEIMNLSVRFQNLNQTPLRTFIEVQLLKEGQVVDSFASEAVDVVSGGMVNITRAVEIDAEDNYSCEGNFSDDCGMAADENWETAAIGKNDAWSRSLGCTRSNYVYENFTLSQPELVNFSLKTNLNQQFTCQIPQTEPGTLRLRTRIVGKNTNCMTVCIMEMTEHYYACPVEYLNGGSWQAAAGGFTQLDTSGCSVDITQYYEGELLVMGSEEQPDAHNFQISWPVSVGPGNYSLKIIAYYPGGQDVREDWLLVKDRNPPMLKALIYNQSMEQNNPEVLQLVLDEESDVQGSVVITRPDGSSITLPLRQVASRPDKVLAATFLDTAPGNYSFNFTACDEFGNCLAGSNYSFAVESCMRGARVLVVNEHHLLDGEQAAYCLVPYSREFNPSPPLEYLQRFDAVVWSAGNTLNEMTAEDAAGLLAYVERNGSVLLEGADIAFQFGDNEFMREVAHAVLLHDLSFVASGTVNESVHVKNLKNYPLLQGLDAKIPFNAGLSGYPDALEPVNGGQEIAAWDDGSAIVVGEAGAKTLFVSFALAALRDADREVFLKQSLAWLVDKNESDVALLDVRYPYLIEGNNNFTVLVRSSDVVSAVLAVGINNQIKQEIPLQLAPGNNEITVSLELPAGTHNLSLQLNPLYEMKERYYFNNLLEREIRVAGRKADIQIESIDKVYQNRSLLMQVNASNIGGSPTRVVMHVYVNDSLQQEQEAALDYGESELFDFRFEVAPGSYLLQAFGLSDENEDEMNNNQLNQTLYICSKIPVLVVADVDEGAATEHPGNGGLFTEILQRQGYCVEQWNVESQGLLDAEDLGAFPVVVWSRGDYFGNPLNDSVLEMLNAYSGHILFEGADWGFDGNQELFSAMGASFQHDLILRNLTLLQLRNHTLLEGIDVLELNASLSPYPDGMQVQAAESVAEWGDGSSAIFAYQMYGSKRIHLGFSLDAVIDAAAQEKLVENSMRWFDDGGEMLRLFSGEKMEYFLGLGQQEQHAYVRVPRGRNVEKASFFVASGRQHIIPDEEELRTFNDNSSSRVLEFSSEKNVTLHLRLPKNAVVLDAGYDLGLRDDGQVPATLSARVESEVAQVASSSSSGFSSGGLVQAQDVQEQDWGGACSLSGYQDCYEGSYENSYGSARAIAHPKIAYKTPLAWSGDLGGFTGYYVVGPLKFDYYCRAVEGDTERFYYDYNKEGSQFGCDGNGCVAAQALPSIGSLTLAPTGSTFDKVTFLCWVYDRDDRNGDWATIAAMAWFNNIHYSGRLYTVACYSDLDCGTGKKCYKKGAWNNWYCGAQPACNSNADCGNSGWTGSPECAGSNVQQTYTQHTCNNPGQENAYCGSSVEVREKLACGNGQYCSSGSCFTAACTADGECGSDGYANAGYCKDGDVYRDYQSYACNNPRTAQAACAASNETRLIQDCTARESCEQGVCKQVACFADSDCGAAGFRGSNFCEGNKVYSTYRTPHCDSPGNSSAQCTSVEESREIQECSSSEYCSDGQCLKAVCSVKRDCGTDEFIGERSCYQGDVVQKYRTYSCNSGGSGNASCSFYDILPRVEDCSDVCFNGKCVAGVADVKAYVGDELVWEHAGRFAGPVVIHGFSAAVNRQLRDCANDVCDVALTFSAASLGNLEVSNLSVAYYLDVGYPGNLAEPAEDVRIIFGKQSVWEYAGSFAGKVQVHDAEQAVNSYLQSCQANLQGTCSLPIAAAGKQGILKLYNLQLQLGSKVDADYDGVVDAQDTDQDNDGVNDTEDKLLGKVQDIKTNIPALEMNIDNSNNNAPRITIEDGNQPILEFVAGNVIDFQNISIEKQEDNADAGYVMVQGLSLGDEHTKSVYVDALMDNATGVCVKDAEISSIQEISRDCSGADELYLPCNGFDNLGYQCRIAGGRYKISGLKHSGVMETDVEFDFDADGFYSREDCDDTNRNVHPGAAEVCNARDDDCDGKVDEELTRSYGSTDVGECSYGMETCNAGLWGVSIPAVNASLETCNNLDDNCNGNIDEDLVQQQPCGVGVCSEGIQTKTCNAGSWPDWGACSTANKAAAESCNNLDDDCDGSLDELLTRQYGVSDVGECSYGVETCSSGSWSITAKAVESGSEICNNLDDDCDGKVDEELIQQQSCGVGVCSGGLQTKTCNAGAWPDWGVCSTSNKAGGEVCDGSDNNCNGQTDEGLKVAYYEDKDGDGYGATGTRKEGCSRPAGAVDNGDDCNDENSGAHKIECDVCGGKPKTYYKDADNDGHGDHEKVRSSCEPLTEYSENSNDCDDTNKEVHEVINGVCGGPVIMYYKDEDKDGFGNPVKSVNSRKPVEGYVLNSQDCNDGDKELWEPVCDVCGGSKKFFYKDVDGDGYGDPSNVVRECSKPEGRYVDNENDCDDKDPLVSPGQKEFCNQKDDNCNGKIDEDLRVDGGWSAWGDFGGCNAACGGGLQTRTRICNNPAPFCGGKQCEGKSIESMPCNIMECTSLAMKSNINTLLLGESFNIEWDAKGAFVCGASGDWSGKLQLMGNQKVTPESVGLRTYVIDCFSILGDIIATQNIQVNVEQPGDFDKTSCVDLDDFFLFANHYGLKTGENLWDAAYDLDKNGGVDLEDLFKFAENYGKGNCNAAAKPVALTEEQLKACKNPSGEICNKIDDDCNGEVDEGCVEQKNSTAFAEPEDVSEEGLSSAPPSILKADFDGNGCVGFEDFFLLAEAYGKQEKKFDLDADGWVDYDDMQRFEKELGRGECG